jgi:hypothetical protein
MLPEEKLPLLKAAIRRLAAFQNAALTRSPVRTWPIPDRIRIDQLSGSSVNRKLLDMGDVEFSDTLEELLSEWVRPK